VSVIESTVDGRYQVIARIASGGMGEVYRAQDVVLGRDVALKVLHAQYAGDRGFVDRFRREARAAAILNHPNIVGVYDWGVTDGTYFMVMEFVRGHNLRSLLLHQQRLEPVQVAEVAIPVLAALDHAHGHGIVHRDIKPENILISSDGTVKVADFGLARAFADSHVSQAEGTVTGTVQYLAPEQVKGQPADPRTDLYALGVVMFELLTGGPPYAGETSVAIAYQHLSSRIPAPSSVIPELDPAMDEPVMHATEPDRAQRPASARTMAGEVNRARLALPPAPTVAEIAAQIPPGESALPDRATTVTIPRVESRGSRRGRRFRRALIFLLTLAVLGGGAWVAWTRVIPHYANVPRLAGLTVKQAQDRLHGMGLKSVVGVGEFSSTVDGGLVIRTDPVVGTKIRTTEPVTLIPSRGPELIAVPNMVGKSEGFATRTLEGLGFKVTPKLQFDDQAPKGQVIDQSPQDVKLEKGSEVIITISKGPQLIKIPDVAGQKEADAKATLQALGFQTPTTTEDFSTSVKKGDVIRTDPPIGSEAPKGSDVTLVVSKGPKTFAMPNVVGMTAEAATAKLEGLGLKVEEVRVPGSIGDTVVGQKPDKGTTVQQGQKVTIYVGG
jgi:beta-lactam-binding protein with PASTA domain/predicted Ser/Thr protein kinase